MALPCRSYSSRSKFAEGLVMQKRSRRRFFEYSTDTAKTWPKRPPGRLPNNVVAYHIIRSIDIVSDIDNQTTPALSEIKWLHSLVMADVDSGTARTLVGIIGPFLSAFGFLFIIRIVMSWYPKIPVEKFPYVIVYAPTEPFLVFTRKVIPPLGGVDVTPVVWFGLVSFLNEILVGPQGLLVLLSQKV
ncbi:hypothetical protein HPP92_002193 [Vanilla planifolia]|uniref:Protein COFACTOR ASSEMBLY OF COMPLEX C SUBUNIT B CCB3, chloroplastic n=1 Tax=Vanilla planifolia TaxID=51239 RepID=A0A835S017_VANPL|nr:hypothetical protein HPP92_002496 [Vanilla planifolia]KAG0502121.1 hypothetical protein HPP92_002193 [Vanilla planifolia]